MSEEIINKEKETRKETRKEYEIPPLSRFEFLLCFVFWFYVVISGCYQFYKLIYNKRTLRYFKRRKILSPTHFGLYKFTNEDSWGDLEIIILDGLPYFVFYLMISRLLRSTTSPKIFMSVCVVLSIYFNYRHSSMKYVRMIGIIFVFSAAVGFTRSKILVWIICLIMLFNLENIVEQTSYQNEYLFNHGYAYMGLIITRGISVGLMIAEAPKFSFQLILEMLFYFLYFPALFGCRMMVARNFIPQIYKPYVVDSWKVWLCASLRLVIYFLCWSVISNLVHVKLIFVSHDLNGLTMTALIGSQIFHGLHYYMVYLVLYKGGYLISQFDGFLTSDGPECIAHITLYSRMWRNFDRGMHDWLKDVAFRPIVRLGPWYITKHVGALACFGIVGLFLGVVQNHVFYVLLNMFQYYIQNVLVYLFLKTQFGHFMEKTFSSINLRRIFGLLGGMSFFVATYSFIGFQFGVDIANTMYQLMFNTVPNMILMICFAYSHSQISITTCEYLNKRKSKTS